MVREKDFFLSNLFPRSRNRENRSNRGQIDRIVGRRRPLGAGEGLLVLLLEVEGPAVGCHAGEILVRFDEVGVMWIQLLYWMSVGKRVTKKEKKAPKTG